MKKIIFLALIISIFCGCRSKTESVQTVNVERRDDLYYPEGRDEPYSGDYKGKYENGQIKEKGRVVAGKRDGEWLF